MASSFSTLLRLQSPSTFIYRLPADMLREIFILASHNLPVTVIRYFSQVCSLWRAVALSCPPLWCELLFTPFSGSPDWMHRLIRRCMDNPISVIYTTLPPDHKPFKDSSRMLEVLEEALKKGMGRLTKLALIHLPDDATNIMHSLSRPAPLLRELTINLSDDHFIPSNLFSGVAPSLKHVVISTCTLSWPAPWLRNVTRFSFCSESESMIAPLSLDALLCLLRGMPLLEDLVLGHVLEDTSDRLPLDRAEVMPLRLPLLFSISLTMYLSEAYSLLAHLTVTNSARVEIDIHGEVGAEEVSLLLGTLSRYDDHPSAFYCRPLNMVTITSDLGYNTIDDNVEIQATEAGAQSPFIVCYFRQVDNLQAVESALMRFATSVLPVKSLRHLCLSIENNHATHDALVQLLSACQSLHRLTLSDVFNPWFVIKTLASEMVQVDQVAETNTQRKRRRKRSPAILFLPQLRTLTLDGADLRDFDDMLALIKMLRWRTSCNARLHTLRVTDALGMDDNEFAVLRPLVDRLKWDEIEQGFTSEE